MRNESIERFNLLPYVHREIRLSAKFLGWVTLIYITVLAFFYLGAMWSEAELQLGVHDIQLKVDKAIQEQKPKMVSNQYGAVVGVLPRSVVLDSVGFYNEFEALSKLKLEGIWLTSIAINRSMRSIKIEGQMTDSKKLNSLLAALKREPAFSDVTFKGVSVKKAVPLEVPYSLREKVESVNVPPLYQFVIQTTPMSKVGG